MEKRQRPEDNGRKGYTKIKTGCVSLTRLINCRIYSQHVSQDHEMIRISNLVLDARYFSRLRLLATPKNPILPSQSTHIYTNDQTNKHSI